MELEKAKDVEKTVLYRSMEGEQQGVERKQKIILFFAISTAGKVEAYASTIHSRRKKLIKAWERKTPDGRVMGVVTETLLMCDKVAIV